MAYTKTIWTEITAITTTLLNKIEDGVEAAHNAIASISLDWSSITGKPSTFTPSTHSHLINDVTSLQTTLDGKASTSHNHDTAYLGKTAQAADSNKISGKKVFIQTTQPTATAAGDVWISY